MRESTAKCEELNLASNEIYFNKNYCHESYMVNLYTLSLVTYAYSRYNLKIDLTSVMNRHWQSTSADGTMGFLRLRQKLAVQQIMYHQCPPCSVQQRRACTQHHILYKVLFCKVHRIKGYQRFCTGFGMLLVCRGICWSCLTRLCQESIQIWWVNLAEKCRLSGSLELKGSHSRVLDHWSSLYV